MTVTITVEDIHVFNKDLPAEQVEVLIRDGLALARRVAPCIDEPDFKYGDAAAAIIRGAILRWAESGSGGITQRQTTAGPFSQNLSFDNRQSRRSLFFPSEITELQDLCKANAGAGSGKAFGIDTVPDRPIRCRRPIPGCTYLFGSVSSPCLECGDTFRHGYWEPQ